MKIRRKDERHHLPFSLLLTGGGARGLAHIGVLRALEHEGLLPSAIVGVSMGAIVGATYALNPDWYECLVTADIDAFARPSRWQDRSLTERLGLLLSVRQLFWGMVTSWGVGTRNAAQVRALFDDLTLGRGLGESALPLAVTATDLGSGERVVFTSGNAAEALYASSALPGIFPPLTWRGRLLADGAVVDNAPVDVARRLLPGPVVAVDVCPPLEAHEPGNGAAVLMRALSINLNYHMWQQFRRADLVLQPEVPFGTLEFGHRREGVAAGVHAVRNARQALHKLLVLDETRKQPTVRRLAWRQAQTSSTPTALPQPDGQRLSA